MIDPANFMLAASSSATWITAVYCRPAVDIIGIPSLDFFHFEKLDNITINQLVPFGNAIACSFVGSQQCRVSLLLFSVGLAQSNSKVGLAAL
jgi:hypothetical protein